MIFKGLYSAFGRVNAVVVWLNKHELAIVGGEEFFDLLCALIVHHVQFYLVSFASQKFELCFVHCKTVLPSKPDVGRPRIALDS